jgi:Fe2+ transport system protein FeoA
MVEGQCAGAALCPLNHVEAGSTVCIRELSASPEIQTRLREMGFCESQNVKLVSRNSNIICQICNARLGISERLAETILVEPVTTRRKVA